MNPYPLPYDYTPGQIGWLSPILKNNRITDAGEKGDESRRIQPPGKGDLKAPKREGKIHRRDPARDDRALGRTAQIQNGGRMPKDRYGIRKQGADFVQNQIQQERSQKPFRPAGFVFRKKATRRSGRKPDQKGQCQRGDGKKKRAQPDGLRFDQVISLLPVGPSPWRVI